MKKFFASIAAAALILPGATAMAAPQHNDKDNHGQQVSKAAKSNGHKFKKGEKFDRSKATNYRVVSYRDHSRLSAPPSGYRWVQDGNDALLVGITSGIVSAVVSNALN